MTTSARFARAGSVHDGDLGRSGPKRLDNGRCGVALTTPSRDEASIAVPHTQVGRCLSTLVNLALELGVKFAGDLLEAQPSWSSENANLAPAKPSHHRWLL